MAGRELTGNHYLSFPEIEHHGAAIPLVTAVHSALAGVLAWTGDPLLQPVLTIDEQPVDLGALQWERLERWIPRARVRTADCDVTLTVCAPAGYDPLIRGAFIELELHSHASGDRKVAAALEVHWRDTTLHVRTGRALPGPRRITSCSGLAGLALEVGALPFGAALAVGAEDERAVQEAGAEAGALRTLAEEDVVTASGAEPLVARIVQLGELRAKRTTRFVFFLGLGRDRDSALAAVRHLRRLGADGLLRRGRLALSQLVRRADDHTLSEVLNRNLLFNHFFAVGRGLDDDRLHALASRSPHHGITAAWNERDVLLWTLPALTLNDPLLARELLIRAFEVFSGAPAQPARYIDGGILEPGFVLDHLLAYPLALERYAREADDPSVVDDPVIQDVLREIDAALYNRLHRDVLLCETEMLGATEPSDFPYPTFGNVLLWCYSRMLPSIWRPGEDEPAASFDAAAEEVAAAIWQRCTVDVDGAPVLVSSTNLQGEAAVYDDPGASLAMLPYLGFCAPDDPIWRNTMELLRSSAYPLWHGEQPVPGLAPRAAPGYAATAALATELLGPGRDAALAALRRVQFQDGVASDLFDPATGQTAAGPHAAAVAGFLAWAIDRGAQPSPRKRRRR